MSRKNGKNNKNLHVVLPKNPELAVCRYTFDTWKRCYPGSSYRDYENEQCPDNLMDSLALEFDSLSVKAGQCHLFCPRPETGCGQAV